MSQLLKDSIDKINRFIEEAQISLKNECGFSAMLTIFPVVLTISESIYTTKKKGSILVECLISLFIRKMNDKAWFRKTNNTNATDKELCKILTEVRHGLTHQISLPIGVILVKDSSVIGESNIEGYDYIIVVDELILSVRKTLEDIVSDKNNSTCCIDGKVGNIFPPRRVAGQVNRTKLDIPPASGSSAS